MKEFKIPTFRLDEAKKIASKHNVELIVGPEVYVKELRTSLVTISVELPQPENVPALVAYAHVDGDRHSFSKKWEWTEANINTVDFFRCDRCKTRHHRHKVFIVEVAGELLQVGGHCATEMDCELRMGQLCRLRCEVEEELDEGLGGGSGAGYINIEEYLRIAAVLVKLYGYTSKKNAEIYYKRSTVEQVLGVLTQDDKEEKENWKKLYNETLTEEEKEYGYWTGKCMDYLNAQEFSEYIHNCKIAITTGKDKLVGFAISVIGQLIKVEREAKAKFVRSVVPAAGEKINIEGQITRIIEADGYMGGSVRRITVDDQKYGKVWFQTTSVWAFNKAKEGDKIKCVINVKEVKDNIIFAKRASKIELNDVGVK